MSQEAITFTPLQPGDAGWIVHRHGVAIAPEFGWDWRFEALCARIMADFIDRFRPEDEASWVARRDGQILGSLLLVRESATAARLRLLYVEKDARGLGLATALLTRAIAFAREKGYATLMLFTTNENANARRIYERLGMRLTKEEPMEFAGKAQIGETWELAL
jgi:GNAT superfamily N-acetyltransferase